MAGLGADPNSISHTHSSPAPPPPLVWTGAQTRTQFRALAHLRWNLFRNNFRRKGGKGELIARIIFLPFLAAIAAGPILGAGYLGYFAISSGRLNLLLALTWGIFLLWQLVSINLSPAALTFDINVIIRFPLSFLRYLAARFLFGLLSPANVIGTLATLAATIGISIARPSLSPWTVLLLSIYALSNIIFTRMIFAWIDRWLSTRRAREVLAAFVLFGSLGLQYLNVTFNPGLQGPHHHASHYLPFLLHIFHLLLPLASILPPGLAASSIKSFIAGHYPAAVSALICLLAFTALFLAIYAWRMQHEFHGEALDELNQPRPAARPEAAAQPARTSSSPTFGLSPIILVSIHKELLYLRRSPNQLYGFLAPLFMVFIFSGRIASTGAMDNLILPTGVAYSLLGIAILSYNCLGLDGTGVQLYLLAPIPLRQVILAKNLLLFLLLAVEFVVIFGVISFVARTPSLLMSLATLAWLLFTAFLSAAIGNIRSIVAPTKIDPGKIGRKQVSNLNGLIALALILCCCGAGLAIYWGTRHIHQPWLMVPSLLVLALGAFFTYLRVLNRIGRTLLEHRENLVEVLAKA